MQRQLLIEKQESKRAREKDLTNDIDGGFAIAKPSTGTIRKIDSIWQVISSGQRLELVVVPIVDQRIPKDEVARNLRFSPSTKT